MSRISSAVLMGASGAGGAYLYNHSDLVESFVKDGSRGILHQLTAPTTMSRTSNSNSTGGDISKLTGMVSSLSNQVDMLSQTQRSSHSVIVSASQPSTVLGMPLWKAVGLIGTAGTIYMKLNGYELRDMVYVSKKHFDTATSALKQQYEQLEETVQQIKIDLMQRIGLVDEKIDEARDSINATLTEELGKVDQRIDGVSTGLKQLDARVASTSDRIDLIGADIKAVQLGLGNITSELDSRFQPIKSDVERFKEESSQGQRAICQEMNNMHSKIDSLAANTQNLYIGLDKQSKGIALLCEFVSKSNTIDSPELLEELQMFATSERNAPVPTHTRTQSLNRFARKPSDGLARIKAMDNVAVIAK